MNAKEIARRLEFIKYLTLKKKSAIFSLTGADVDKMEEIKNDKYIELSGNYSFNIESIINDYGANYSSSLQSKEMKIYFGKHPIIGPIIGSGPDHEYKIINDPDGLMTPAIIQDYVKDGKSFKRYIFPSDQDDTYSRDYKIFNDWHQTTSIDIDKNYSRPRSMTILVEESTPSYFENFLNESESHWQSRFSSATDLAKSGNFYWFSLYHPKIYEYELSFEDRKSILNYMVYSLSWTYIFEGYGGTNGVDEYELFSSLITSTSKDDGKKFYDYMFTIDSLTGKTNLQVYKDKLDDDKLYDSLIQTLMKFFYSTKEITEFKDGFRKELLYPIGYIEKIIYPYKDQDNTNIPAHFNLEEQKYVESDFYQLGVKYDIEKLYDSSLQVKIKSAFQYKFNVNLLRVEFKGFDFIGQEEEWDFDETIYVASYLNNQKLEGLNIPFGTVIPIPAFALPWLVEKNNKTEDIIDLIEKGATAASVVFPIFQIFEGVSVIYNIIGLGFTLVSNTLDAGIADQIQRFDDFQSNALGHPYSKGNDFLDTYYLFSAIYGGISLGKALKGKTIEEQFKVLTEFETLLSIKGIVDDINSFYGEESSDSLKALKKEMDQLQTNCNSYKYLKNSN